MTDEEKQAIEILKTIKRPTLATGFERQTNLLKSIETVLNFIKKQQAEIEEEKKKSMHYEKLITNGLASKEIAKIDEEMQTVLRTEIEKQDKIIDEMANHIATSDNNLCQYLDMTTKCKYYAGENKNTCDNCIKDYFKKKVEVKDE